MIYTNLKEIFPNSFVDHMGRRKAKVVLYGRHKASEIAERVEKHLSIGEHVSVNDFAYDGRYRVTRFVLQASGNTTPFLPRIDIADLQEMQSQFKEKKEEDNIPPQDNFSSKWDSFLNL
jgi:hypothetical protein